MASMATPASTHLFLADGALGRDWRGRSYCRRCNLPETSARHRAGPQRWPLDHAQRAAGERPDVEDREGVPVG